MCVVGRPQAGQHILSQSPSMHVSIGSTEEAKDAAVLRAGVEGGWGRGRAQRISQRLSEEGCVEEEATDEETSLAVGVA